MPTSIERSSENKTRSFCYTLKPTNGDAIVVARDVNQFRHCNGRWRSIDLIDNNNNRVASFCIPPIGLLQSFRRRHQLLAKARSNFARSHSSVRVTTGNNRNVCSRSFQPCHQKRSKIFRCCPTNSNEQKPRCFGSE